MQTLSQLKLQSFIALVNSHTLNLYANMYADVCICDVCTCVCACAYDCPERSEEDWENLEAGFVQHGYWELNLGPLEEQQVLLPIGPSLQP